MKPRIAIPEPHSGKRDYVERTLPQYIRAVEESGGEAVVISLQAPPEDIAKILARCQGVLLPGSSADVEPSKYSAARDPRTNPADPKRDTADELLLQDAYNMRKPIFGICYGIQSLNVYRSGTLVQHLETGVNHEAGAQVKRAHRLRIDSDSRLAHMLSEAPGTVLAPTPDYTALGMMVNSSHHQAVDRAGDGLRIVARCEEDGVIEAVEGVARDHWVFGVQWHPERTFDDDASSRGLFAALVDAAERWREP
jgi:putative glutamine amidotransferase